jgi:hypothetical protein
LRAEHEILLCIARKSLDERASQRLRELLQKEVEWDYLLKSAADHGLLPLLCTHLDTHSSNLATPEILAHLRHILFKSRQDNLYLLRQLLSVLDLFKANGIRTLAFKGPILGVLLYGDPGLRQAGDLDILIAKDDFRRAKDLLQSNHYLMEPQLTAFQQASHLRFHCEIQFLHQDLFTVVDLHWGLTPKSFPFPLSLEDIFKRSSSFSIAGHTIETFAAEDLLLYLCVHGAKHYWTRLEWVASIAELAGTTEKLDWSLIVRLARESASETVLCLGLLLAQRLFALELVSDVQELLSKRRGLAQIALQLENTLFEEGPAAPNQLETFRWNLQFMSRRRDAVASLLRSVLVPTIADWQAVRLPDRLYPLYYGLRPIRLLSKYFS